MFEVKAKTPIQLALAKWPLLVKWLGFPLALSQALRHHLFYRRRLKERAIGGAGVDIVTVVYQRELTFLRLQARSFARWLDPAFDGTIIVIVNELVPSRSIEKIRRWILPEYGRWRDRVQIVPFYQLGAGLNPYNSYVFQQPLKLAAAALIDKPFYVVFDAKNHAVRPFSAASFISPDGRGLRAGVSQIEMPRYHEACARYFGFDPTSFSSMPFVAGTPFILHTQSVRDLMRSVELREGRSFFSFFCGRRWLSEFLLYSFYLRTRGEIDIFHSVMPPLWRTFWPHDDSLALRIDEMEAESRVLFFAVHRCALKRLNAEEKALLESCWRRHALLDKAETFADLEADLKGVRRPRALPSVVRPVGGLGA